jgi:transcriptional regulator with XRE-family HTH domain
MRTRKTTRTNPMAPIRERVRQARDAAGMSCAELARRVGVGRTAAVQWEKEDGTAPSVENMARVAVVLGVTFEWLATGRGPTRNKEGTELPAVMSSDFAHNLLEERLLRFARKLPRRNAELLVELVENLAAKHNGTDLSDLHLLGEIDGRLPGLGSGV